MGGSGSARDRRRWRARAVPLAAALAVASVAGGVTASTAGAAMKTLTVGDITSVTGIGDTFTGFQAGVQAFFRYYDAHGGVDGYNVKLISLDDAGDPAKNSSEARTLVEQDHAIAIVGEASIADAASQKYLQEAGAPVIGGWEASPAWLRPATNMFDSLAGPNAPYCPLWSSPLAKAEGVKSIAFIAQNFPEAVEDAQCRMAAAKREGIKVDPSIITTSLTAVSYTPAMQQAMATGAQAVYFSTGTNGFLLGIQAGVELGYKGFYILTQPAGVISGLGPKLVKAVSGRVLTSVFSLLPTDPSSYSPELGRAKAGIAKYEPAYTKEITAISGWAAGKLFADALKNGGPNGAAMEKWISGQTAYTFGGLQGPMNYTNGSEPNPCTTSLVLKNGAWTRPPMTAKPPHFDCSVLINPKSGAVDGPPQDVRH